MPEDALIRAEKISLQFSQRPILQSVSLNVRPREVVTLIGPNGAGKTTLVRIVLGLMAPDSGRVWRAPGLRIGYMPQKLDLEPTLPLTVKRFLQLAHRRRPDVAQMLEEVRVAHLLEQPVGSLSGGEMQRVLLARALSQSPQLLVLDEPAQGVDVAGQVELYELIHDIRRRHDCGVLMISHDLHLVMANTDKVICLNQHICCHGKPEHVSNDPAYLELFGRREADALAIYTHHHNHRHDIAGDVVEEHDHD